LQGVGGLANHSGQTHVGTFEVGRTSLLLPPGAENPSYATAAKKTNEWILNKAEVKRELLDSVKARKL